MAWSPPGTERQAHVGPAPCRSHEVVELRLERCGHLIRLRAAALLVLPARLPAGRAAGVLLGQLPLVAPARQTQTVRRTRRERAHTGTSTHTPQHAHTYAPQAASTQWHAHAQCIPVLCQTSPQDAVLVSAREPVGADGQRPQGQLTPEHGTRSMPRAARPRIQKRPRTDSRLVVHEGVTGR